MEWKVQTSPAMANAIRRTMIGHVPTLAVETVGIRRNDGILPDEILAHRLGLVPLRFSPTTEGSAGEATATFTLRAEGGPRTVYSEEMQFEGVEVQPGIPLTELRKAGDILDLRGTAVMGRGVEHSKWSPCCGTSYGIDDDGEVTFHIETTFAKGERETLGEAVDLLVEAFEKVKTVVTTAGK